MEGLTYSGGRNIALKLPPHQYEDTLRFYRDVLRLAPWPEPSDTISFVFGSNRLWLDRCPALSQAELWLELEVPDSQAAARHLAESGVTRCDAVEPLPEGFRGFWISSPSQIVHLVSESSAP